MEPTKPNRTKTVRQMMAAVGESALRATPDASGRTVVSSLAYDSRDVAPGALFVALVGERFDGHDYLAQVIEAGAVALVVQGDREAKWNGLPVPCIHVPNTREVLARLAVAFYDNPTKELFLAGVTGTNGKTTTVRMIDSIARAAGDITGTIGTLGATVAGQALPGDRTTPEAPDLQKLFRAMVDAGAKSAAIEVASHALSMGRTDGCLFDVGVFTNLTQDHLDYHGTMENYRDAKAKLFTDYADAAAKSGKRFSAVLNADDPAAEQYHWLISDIDDLHPDRINEISYGKLKDKYNSSDLYFKSDEVVLKVDSLQFTVYRNPNNGWRDLRIDVTLPFGGAFNIYNALGAVGYGLMRGLSPEVIAKGLATCPPVPGRFEPVKAGQDFAVLVDYAHTPDGLQNVLASARPLTMGRLIVVFGCGGNRDKTKRPLMGKIALDLADIAIVTSDNPRREEPEAILDDILAGMTVGTGRAQILREADRRAAIALAIQTAQAGDTIVIAGKGHEGYQIIGEQTFPFSDVVVAREEITKCSAR